MNPAAPVTRSFISLLPLSTSLVRLGLALGEVSGQAIVPGGQPDRVFALALQDRERGARRGPAEHLGGAGEHFGFGLRLLEDLAGEFVPGALAGGGHVV